MTTNSEQDNTKGSNVSSSMSNKNSNSSVSSSSSGNGNNSIPSSGAIVPGGPTGPDGTIIEEVRDWYTYDPRI